MAVIETQNLTHRYGSFTAVKDVNLTVNEGEIFGFLGPNGAGKTTTIRMILDFIRPDAGEAKVFGMDARSHSVEIRRRVGYLPAELKLWDNWTGKQYTQWLSQVHQKELLPEAQRLADALEFDLKRSLKGMSTGMKRKMGLIAALAHKAPLLILDEPTTGLDPLMQQVFHQLMREARAEGRTVFLSSHNLQEVEDICDRVGIIRAGQLEAVETVQQLTQVTFRWLTLTLAHPAQVDGFSSISGVNDLSAEGSQLRMRISGETDIDSLIKRSAQFTVQDIQLEQPTLEEIFLTYYGKKEQ